MNLDLEHPQRAERSALAGRQIENKRTTRSL